MAAKVTAEDRKKHATLSGGRFPIKNKSQAMSALKLRGHTKSKGERRSVIRRAAVGAGCLRVSIHSGP